MRLELRQSDQHKHATSPHPLPFLDVSTEQEMLRTLTLQHTFGLYLGPVGLINTGVHEYGGTHRPAPPPLEGMDLPLDDKQALERAEVNQLQK